MPIPTFWKGGNKGYTNTFCQKNIREFGMVITYAKINFRCGL